MENREATSQNEGKEVAEVSDEVLAQALAQSQKLQEQENAGEGVKADYILLAKQGSKALKRSQKDLYIDGLAIGDFYIQKDKLNLGSELKVVPLAFITVYNEKDGTGLGAKFFGMWNKEQAVQYPVAEGSYFNRQLPNGHILEPSNWVMVEVLGHHDIKNAVIAYKRTGSRIWKAWKEDAKSRAGSSATLVYRISEEVYSNADNEWTDISFAFDSNLLEKDRNEALHCLQKSNSLRESYEKALLIGNHDVSAVAVPAKPAAIEAKDASETEDSFDDEELGF